MTRCAYCEKPIHRYAIYLEGVYLHIDCVADYNTETIACLEATEESYAGYRQDIQPQPTKRRSRTR